jgi:NodT family efflux transporter outer membrane factor (OMF) lipoprotein
MIVFLRRGVGALCALVLTACSLTMPPSSVTAPTPVEWSAPLPHGGSLTDLRAWWKAQNDPVLVALIDDAQALSPTVAAALSRVEAARANEASARAALLPGVTAGLSAGRSVSLPSTPAATSTAVTLQTTWEIDLFGAARVARTALAGQTLGSQAQWHDARVSVAAEVASTYYALAHCWKAHAAAEQELASRQRSRDISALSLNAGMLAPTAYAQVQAEVAQSQLRLIQQSSQCDLYTKALVALTGEDEALVRSVMRGLVLPDDLTGFAVTRIPAQALVQLPDVFAAEHDVALASAQIGRAKARRWPGLSLGGSVGALRYGSAGVDTDLTTWSFGPLALTLPVFDAGQRAALVDAATADYVAAVATYRGKVRQAVREVEEALVTLDSTLQRETDTRAVREVRLQNLTAAQIRERNGLANALEVEEARRALIAAQTDVLALQLERKRAWVALYRAAGGGWERPAAESAPQP